MKCVMHRDIILEMCTSSTDTYKTNGNQTSNNKEENRDTAVWQTHFMSGHFIQPVYIG